jgi:hypothetical protein
MYVLFIADVLDMLIVVKRKKKKKKKRKKEKKKGKKRRKGKTLRLACVEGNGKDL